MPLAAAPADDGVEFNWWWLLLIAFTGAFGTAAYENHKKKVQAQAEAEAAKKN